MRPPTGGANNGPVMDGEETERATADRDDDRVEATPSYAVTGGPRLSRRRLLRVLGLGTLAVVPLPVLPELFRAAGQPEPVHGLGEPARTRDGRIRQWTMIIDLRSCDGCQSIGQPPQVLKRWLPISRLEM